MGNFYWVNLKSTNNSERILMEEGTRFENKGAIYTMKSNGKLSIFDKEEQKEIVGDTINLKDYQYQTVKAVINNCNDGKKVNALSNDDIKQAMKMHENGKLGNDLSQFLKGDYEVENPKRFSNENKFSAYITNGIKKFSAVLSFQYKVDSVQKNARPDKAGNDTGMQPLEDVKQNGKFTGDGLFSNKAIKERKSFIYSVHKGEDLVSIATKYEIDTYQLIAANPQLKENKDYQVIYPSDGLAKLKSSLKPNQKITIPARYDVKKGTCKNLKDVANITGVSEAYLKDFLTKVEVENQDGNPDLCAYLDDGGTPTIGYGHTGRVNGKPISCRKKSITKIKKEEALEILAEDILKHKAMSMAYLGKTNYLKAPKSVQDTILDIAYNKGIWDGYLTNQGYASSTRKIKKDLKQGHYASALVHSRREKTGFRGLRKRNIYRFISGLSDLTPQQRKAAMKAMKPYYLQVLSKCKSYDKPALKKAWENAEKGMTTGYKIR